MAVHMEVSSRENRAAALTWVKSRPRHPRRPNGTTRSAISEIALDQCPLAGKSQAVDRAEPTPVRSATEAMMADTQIEASPAPPARAAPAAARRSLHREIDRLFDLFAEGFGFPLLHRMFERGPLRPWEGDFGALVPAVEISEDGQAYRITAELPGLEAKDIDISMSDHMLVLKGEKRADKEEKDKNYYLCERSYGAFQRAFPLPEQIDRDKVTADFAKGVLTITLPKAADNPPPARSAKACPRLRSDDIAAAFLQARHPQQLILQGMQRRAADRAPAAGMLRVMAAVEQQVDGVAGAAAHQRERHALGIRPAKPAMSQQLESPVLAFQHDQRLADFSAMRQTKRISRRRHGPLLILCRDPRLLQTTLPQAGQP